MKKLTVLTALLLLVFFGYSQERSRAFYKTMLSEFKALPVNSAKARDIVINEVSKDMGNIKDSVMLSEYQSFIDELSKREFTERKARSLSTLSTNDLKGFRVNEDKFQKSTFINPMGPMSGIKDPLEIYLVIDEYGYLAQRLRIRYYGSDWVFMEKVLFLVDDEVYEFYLKSKPRRDVSGGRVYETSDELMTPELYEILLKILHSTGDVSVRFEGDSFHDMKVSSQNMKRLKKSDDLYQKLSIK